VVIAGDINIAFADIDVHKKERKKDVIGQREEERALFRAILDKGKLVDVGRKLWPDDDQLFSWWPYWREARAKNVGWRIDYVLASESLAARVKTAVVLREFGSSDHAPVVVDFED
jgi:exodeoxyribonuclease III